MLSETIHHAWVSTIYIWNFLLSQIKELNGRISLVLKDFRFSASRGMALNLREGHVPLREEKGIG